MYFDFKKTILFYRLKGLVLLADPEGVKTHCPVSDSVIEMLNFIGKKKKRFPTVSKVFSRFKTFRNGGLAPCYRQGVDENCALCCYATTAHIIREGDLMTCDLFPKPKFYRGLRSSLEAKFSKDLGLKSNSGLFVR